MSSMRTVGDAPSVSGVSNLNRPLSAPASPDGRGKLNRRQLPPDPSAEPVSATTMEYVSPPSIDARTRSAFCGNVLVRRARYLSSPLFSRLRLITAVSACPATLPFDSRLFRPEPLDSVRSEEHTSELQSRGHLVWRLLLEKKNKYLPLRRSFNYTFVFR